MWTSLSLGSNHACQQGWAQGRQELNQNSDDWIWRKSGNWLPLRQCCCSSCTYFSGQPVAHIWCSPSITWWSREGRADFWDASGILFEVSDADWDGAACCVVRQALFHISILHRVFWFDSFIQKCNWPSEYTQTILANSMKAVLMPWRWIKSINPGQVWGWFTRQANWVLEAKTPKMDLDQNILKYCYSGIAAICHTLQCELAGQHRPNDCTKLPFASGRMDMLSAVKFCIPVQLFSWGKENTEIWPFLTSSERLHGKHVLISFLWFPVGIFFQIFLLTFWFVVGSIHLRRRTFYCLKQPPYDDLQEKHSS